MKLSKDTRQKIIRDGIISVFIYALPVASMFIYFSLTHQKPWLHRAKQSTTIVHH